MTTKFSPDFSTGWPTKFVPWKPRFCHRSRLGKELQPGCPYLCVYDTMHWNKYVYVYIYYIIHAYVCTCVYNVSTVYHICLYQIIYIHVSHMEMSKGSEHSMGTWPACHRDKIWWVRFKTFFPGTLTPILSIPGWDIDPPNLDSSNPLM